MGLSPHSPDNAQRFSAPRSGVAALFALLLLAPAGWVDHPAAAAATPRAQELEHVLRELREVEAEIERYLMEQAGQPGRRAAPPATIQPDASSLDSPAPDASAPAPRMGHEERLREWGLGASDEIQAVARAKVEARTRLGEAESGVRLSSALLVDELTHPTQPEVLLTLALMQSRHRASANLAVEQLLQLEGTRIAQRPEPAPVRAEASAPAPLPATPSRLEELRHRHREISNRLSELSSELEASRSPTMQFREQRTQLNALMARLSRDESSRMSSGSGSPNAASNTAVSPSGFPDESGLVPALPPKPETDGRRVFWRANRARIHALDTGTVLFAGPFAGYRHLLILDHGDGWTGLYGNMTGCYVRVDQRLSKGSVLGEYQAEKVGDPEPFWVEVRRGSQPHDVSHLPGIDEDWQHTLFGDQQP